MSDRRLDSIEGKLIDLGFMVGVLILASTYLVATQVQEDENMERTITHKYENANWIGDPSEEYDEQLMIFDYDIKETQVSCATDSMGLSIFCNNRVFYKDINVNDTLNVGDIYIYSRDNETHKKNVIHRLVYCLDDNCSLAIFKGDNNRVAEIVNRSQITKKLVVQMY